METTSNLPIVNVEDFSNIIKMQFNERNYRPIFGLGKGGIGKTESIYELAKELNIGYVDIRLLLYTETDLKGIPYPNENHTKTIWLENDILPTWDTSKEISSKNNSRGIIVLDEITSAQKSVRTAAYQLLNERKLGSYVLPDGWLVVCLGNGEEDGGDYQGMEGNFANRCSVFNVVPDVDAWKDWAFKHGVNTLVTAYINFKPSDLHSYNNDIDSGDNILFASPRSWVAVSNILNVNEFNYNDRVLSSRIIANLGQEVGHTFLSFCRYKNDTINPEDILKNGAMPKANSAEVINITVQSLIKYISDKIAKDLSTGRNEIQLDTVQYVANALKWILSLRAEYAVMGVKDLIRYNPTVMTRILLNNELHKRCPQLMEFIAKNKAIFND